jgi:MGT family glycosyltransferase
MTRSSARLRFLFATWEGGGSVAPALTVVRKLVERGHEVRVMADACVGPESAAAGAAFTPWRRAPSRLDRTRESDPAQDWLAASPPEGLLRVIDRIWAGPALAYAQDLADELDSAPADLVVTSEFLVGVQAACEARSQPYANLAVNISIFPTPGVPPLGMGLTPATNDVERAQHAEAARMVEGLFDHGLPALNAGRAALGLAPLLHLSDQPRTAAATLLATSRAFDFAPEELSPKLYYVGPQLGEPSCAAPQLEIESSSDGRPLVVVGFSTTYQDHAGALQRVVEALGELPVTGVVTLGDGVKPGEVAPAANVRVVSGASHDALMRKAALVVTHGGHGTVCRALAHHRPLLLMPHGRDQNDNAVRVTSRGAGLALPPSASVSEIRGAVDRLLSEPAFAQAAARLGAAVAEEAARSPVVDVLEDLARSATPAPTAARLSPA